MKSAGTCGPRPGRRDGGGQLVVLDHGAHLGGGDAEPASAASAQSSHSWHEGVEVGLGQGYVAHGTQFSTHRLPEPIHAVPRTRPDTPGAAATGLDRSTCVTSSARRDAFPSASPCSPGVATRTRRTHVRPPLPGARVRRLIGAAAAPTALAVALALAPVTPAAADHERLPQGRDLRTYTVRAGRHRDRPRGAFPRLDRGADLPQPPRLLREPARRPADRDPGGHEGPGQGPCARPRTEKTRAARAPARPRSSAGHPSRDRVRRTIARAANRRGVDPQLALAIVLAGVGVADAPRLQRRGDRRDAGPAAHRAVDGATTSAATCASGSSRTT